MQAVSLKEGIRRVCKQTYYFRCIYTSLTSILNYHAKIIELKEAIPHGLISISLCWNTDVLPATIQDISKTMNMGTIHPESLTTVPSTLIICYARLIALLMSCKKNCPNIVYFF